MNDVEEAIRLEHSRRKRSFHQVENRKCVVDQKLYHVRSCALALTNWKDKLPEDRVTTYEHVVRNNFVYQGQPQQEPLELTPELLQQEIGRAHV